LGALVVPRKRNEWVHQMPGYHSWNDVRQVSDFYISMSRCSVPFLPPACSHLDIPVG
jgi:hypothetical protein